MFVMRSITTSDKPFNVEKFKDALNVEVFSTDGDIPLGRIKSVTFSDDMLVVDFVVE